MNLKDILLLTSFFVFLGISAGAIAVIKTQGTECYSNPYQFSAERLSNDNNAMVECQCQIFKGEGAILYFNKDNLSLVPNRVDSQSRYERFNVSILEDFVVD